MMKLRWAAASPFVRKIHLVAHELGLTDQIELLPTDVHGEDAARGDNPLGKIPCLLLDEGGALYDSPVIAEYLDSLHTGPKLHPDTGPARWQALRLQALGDGICDAAVARRMESNRADGQKSPAFMDRQKKAVDTALDYLDSHPEYFAGPVNIGHLAVGAALGYLDFRFAHEEWRTGRHKLKEWFDGFSQRPSMLQTKP
ncbi:glutathione S-transferase N-terminal domain-containing protein [Lacibacterium aquatile]|uniref:Glutathione S-transferase N-terminal domain-containing protein n=1 Tax=Lacibacterium aquatile TaxID=1168082 RepID=A0ABW5DRH7_9PROT